MEFLLLPFAACLLLLLIHTYFGVHILERGIIFVDLAMAQFIGVGIAVAFLLGMEGDLVLPVIFALGGAAILALSRRVAVHVNIEAFIGVLYIFSLATAILLLDRTPHGTEEFKQLLNGNILWVTPRELLSTAILYATVGGLHILLRRPFRTLSFEGKGGYFLEFLFFASFALVLVKSVRLAGILPVFAFLVVPALIGRLYSREPRRILFVGWSTGAGASLAGILVSYWFDLPTAPVVVTGLSVTFFVLMAVCILRRRTGQSL